MEENTVKIKICGLTDEKETEYLIKNMVDYAGMVLFFEKSRRCISIEKAEKIINLLKGKVKTVAVVVSPTIEQSEKIKAAGFDYIQIHGIPEAGLMENCGLPIIKAFNVTDLDSVSEYQENSKVVGFVFDAPAPGSGKTYDWTLLKNIKKGNKLFFLAGGLTPENVAKAINEVHPDAVDVSTGVEYEHAGGKDPEKIEIFCKNANYNKN